MVKKIKLLFANTKRYIGIAKLAIIDDREEYLEIKNVIIQNPIKTKP